MRKLIYYMAASLDGCIARSDGAIDWLPVPGPKQDYGYAKFLERIDELIVGRKTYEQMLTHGPWPYGDRRCHVLSRKWAGQRDVHAEFTDVSAAAMLRRMRKRPGRDIWLVGGGESAQVFFTAGLVDEIILTVIPMLLGEGRLLFPPQPAGTELKLRDAKVFPDGLVQLYYEVRSGVRQLSRQN